MTTINHISFGKALFLIFVPGSQVHVKAMHQVEQALTKNSYAGMGVSFLSSVLAKVNLMQAELPQPTPGLRETLISIAADTGIVVGLLIGCLTLILKAKEFYKEFIHAAKRRKVRRAKAGKSVAGDSSEGVV